MSSREETIFSIPRDKFHKSNLGFYWILIWFHLNNQGRIWHWVKRLISGTLSIVGAEWKTEWKLPFDLEGASCFSHIKDYKKPVEHCSEALRACLTERSLSSSSIFSLQSFSQTTSSEAEFCVSCAECDPKVRNHITRRRMILMLGWRSNHVFKRKDIPVSRVTWPCRGAWGKHTLLIERNINVASKY